MRQDVCRINNNKKHKEKKIMKKYLIFGATGSVGSNLAKQRLDREIMVEATKRRQALSNFIDLEDPAMN